MALKATLKKPPIPFPPIPLPTRKPHILRVQTMATRVARQATASDSTIPVITAPATSTTSTNTYTIPIAVAVVVANLLIILIIFLINFWKKKRSARQRLRATSISIPQEPLSPHTRPMSQGSLLPLNHTPQPLASASSTTSSHSSVESPARIPSPASSIEHQLSPVPLSASAFLLPQSIRSSTTNLSRPVSSTPSVSPYPSALRPPSTQQASLLTPSPAVPQRSSTYQPAPPYQAPQTTQISPVSQPLATISRPEMTYTPLDSYTTDDSSRLDYDSFKVAVICALEVEANMVVGVLDEKFGTINQDNGDELSYTLGRIGRHNVVIALLPVAGSTVAASATANLTRSFKSINVAFIVGICGIVPCNEKTGQEIVLGDCIISTEVINLNRGAQYPRGFGRAHSVRKVLGKASPKMLWFEKLLNTFDNTNSLELRISSHFEELQRKGKEVHFKPFSYPGADHDHLYDSDYPHCYHDQRRGSDITEGRGLSCRELRCSRDYIIPRERLSDSISSTSANPNVKIHFGRVGSADVVQRSGTVRDDTARKEQLIAFEMEAAGVWDNLKNNVMVIKSGSDYCDSHKNDDWQPYAAAVAACGLKAVLEKWESSSLPTRRPVPQPPLPLPRVDTDQAVDGPSTGRLARREDVQLSITHLYDMPELEAA